MCNTVQNVSHCETDIRKFDGFDAFCAYFFLVHMYMYLQANKLGVLRNVYMHTRMYFWQKKILSLVSLTLHSMRFIWNKILILSTRDLTVSPQVRENFYEHS